MGREKVLVAGPGESLEIDGIRITLFQGLHGECRERTGKGGARAGLRDIPCLGILAEFNSKRWLFPGDTRTYEAGRLPRLGAVDGLFAHVWLGRGCAEVQEPTLREAFCRFYLDLHPRRILLTHLEEFGRGDPDFWGEDQAEGVRRRLHEFDRNVVVEQAKMGDRVLL